MIGKALLVLESIGRRRGPVRLAEIARHTGLPKSTVHRLLVILEENDALRRVSAGYVLGDAIQHLSDGGEGTRRAALRRVLMPHVAELYESTHLPTSVAVLDERTMVCLFTIYPRTLAGPVLRSSERVPAHRTALGRLLLAYNGVSARGLQDDLEPELTRIRQAGIAYHRDEHIAGLAGVAVPVTDRFAGAAAIGLAGSAQELGGAELAALLRRTAHEAELTLRRHRARAV